MRFAILCNGSSLNAWEAATLKSLSELKPAPQLVLAIVDKTTQYEKSVPTSLLQKTRSIGISNILYYLFCRYFFKPQSIQTVPLTPLLDGVERLEVDATTPKKGVHVFPKEAIREIESKKLDFILRFGFNILRGEILNAARFGIWSFHHDDEEKYRGGPPAFWEIYFKDPVTGSVLQRLTERLDSGIVLKKGYFKTIHYSAAANLDQAYWETSKWPALVCREIQSGTLDPNSLAESETKARIFHNPNNTEMIEFLFTKFCEKLRTRFRNWFRHDVWSIGILKKPIHEILFQDFVKPDLIIEHPDKNSFLADPFGISTGNNLKIFCEEYSYGNPVGRICHFPIQDSTFQRKTYSPKLTFLEMDARKLHRSYPFIFQLNGSSYVLPECHQSKQIELWKLDLECTRIEDLKILVKDVDAVDPTLFKQGDFYWLASTLENTGPNSHLYLWYAKDPFGPYTPHAKNPVKIDVRGARPAGSVFEYEGRFYRPSQDCSSDYGYRVRINEIVSLTPQAFEEREVKVLGPFKGPYPSGLHTVSAAGNYTLIDMKRKKMVWPAIQNLLFARTGSQMFANPNQV